MVVSHVVALQAFITLPAGERETGRERDRCVEVQRRRRKQYSPWWGR